ncbi:hypothetical protein BDF22DRAFT_742230 [Syncephalis plumigaleata]|nr:hypothetical protein BDF22DRAFT_742230 [Syncephalis plumigaleata]
MQPHLPSSQHDRLPPLTALLTDVPSESRDSNRPWTHVGSSSTTIAAAAAVIDGNDRSGITTSANSNPTNTSDIFTRIGSRARSYSYGSAHVMSGNRTDVPVSSCATNLSCARQTNLVFNSSNPRQVPSHQSSSIPNNNYLLSNAKDNYTAPSLHINTSMYDVRRDSMTVSPVSTTANSIANMTGPMISNHRVGGGGAGGGLSLSHTIPANPLSTHVTPSTASSMASIAQQSAANNLAIHSTSSSSSLSPLLPAVPSAAFSYSNSQKPNSTQASFDHILSPSNAAIDHLPLMHFSDTLSPQSKSPTLSPHSQFSKVDRFQKQLQRRNRRNDRSSYIHSDGENLGQRTSAHSSSGESSPARRLSPYPIPANYATDGFSSSSLGRKNDNISGAGSVDEHDDVLLTEKRRRNARASARFRDRRKQREREMRNRCEQLEQRVMQLEALLSSSDTGAARLDAERWRVEAQRQASRVCELEEEVFRQRHLLFSDRHRGSASAGMHLKRTPESP